VSEQENRRHDEISELQLEMKNLSETVNQLSKSISDMTEAWRTAKGIVSGVKWLSAIGASCAVVWAALHGKTPP
jgi:predicted  nucleic acid-binding Zn-ribbon protein